MIVINESHSKLAVIGKIYKTNELLASLCKYFTNLRNDSLAHFRHEHSIGQISTYIS